jgi:hypothetical protein
VRGAGGAPLAELPAGGGGEHGQHPCRPACLTRLAACRTCA